MIDWCLPGRQWFCAPVGLPVPGSDTGDNNWLDKLWSLCIIKRKNRNLNSRAFWRAKRLEVVQARHCLCLAQRKRWDQHFATNDDLTMKLKRCYWRGLTLLQSWQERRGNFWSTASKPHAKTYLSSIPCLSSTSMQISHSDLISLASIFYLFRDVEGQPRVGSSDTGTQPAC